MSREQVVTSVDIIVSKGDEEGTITYANPIFFKVAGYSQVELIDQPHSKIRHPDMPKVVFEHLWTNLKAGRDVKVFVKNLCKDGGFYWVFAHVRVATNPDGTFRNYVSTRRAMSTSAREPIEALYAELKQIEDQEGIEAARTKLEAFLVAQGGSLEQFNEMMTQLQKN